MKILIDKFGRPKLTSKQPQEFNYLLGINVNDVIPFEDSTEDMTGQNLPILPRHYYIFPEIINNVIQLKPYEFNQYRINVKINNNIIVNVESIG